MVESCITTHPEVLTAPEAPPLESLRSATRSICSFETAPPNTVTGFIQRIPKLLTILDGQYSKLMVNNWLWTVLDDGQYSKWLVTIYKPSIIDHIIIHHIITDHHQPQSTIRKKEWLQQMHREPKELRERTVLQEWIGIPPTSCSKRSMAKSPSRGVGNYSSMSSPHAVSPYARPGWSYRSQRIHRCVLPPDPLHCKSLGYHDIL